MIKKNQKGFTLVELIFVLVIVGLMMMLEMSKKQAEFDQMQARSLGVEIYQIANAASKFTAYFSGNDDFAPESEYTSLDFLRDADDDGIYGCNNGDSSTPSLSFLDCNFLPDDKTTFGKMGFKITFEKISTTNSNGESQTYLKSKIVFDKLTKKVKSSDTGVFIDREAKSLSGLAALVAAGATTVGSNDPSMLSTVATIGYCMSDSISYCDTDDIGHIVAITSDDSSSQTWLRVDHGNTMQNILEFGSNVNGHDSDGFSLRQIRKVARIFNGEDAGGLNDALILGNDGTILGSGILDSSLPNAGVVVDADMLLYKELSVLSNAAIKGNLTVDGNTDIGGDLTVEGNSLVKKDSEVDGNFKVLGDSDLQGNVDVGKDLGVVGDTQLNGKLTVDLSGHMKSTLEVDQSITTPVIYDRDNTNYYVDPASTSNLNSIIVDTQAELPNNTYITIGGTKRLLSSLLSTYVHMYSATVANGSVIDKPSCDVGGTPKVILTPIITSIRVTTGGSLSYTPTGAAYQYATDNGGSWSINLGTNPGSGTSSSGARSIANAYCSYEVH